MAAKFVVFACLVAAVSAQTGLYPGFLPAPSALPVQVIPAPLARLPAPIEEQYGPAVYQFEYQVNDPETADIKSQQESRDGNALKGTYSFVQPDGLLRIVEYGDDGTGFIANVRYEASGVNVPAYVRSPIGPAPAAFVPAPAPAFLPASIAPSPFAPRFAPRYIKK